MYTYVFIAPASLHYAAYTTSQKLRAVEFAISNGIGASARAFNIPKSTLRAWIENAASLRLTIQTNNITQLDELKGFVHRDLFEKLALPKELFISWLADLGLLHQKRTCRSCGCQMTRAVREGFMIWRCRRTSSGGRCEKEMGYFVGTFFEQVRITPQELFQVRACKAPYFKILLIINLLQLTYYYSRRAIMQDETQFQMTRSDGSTLSSQTIVEFKKMFRSVCANYFIENPIVIGGPGLIVEIDESVITRRKYNRGYFRSTQVWVFGGVVRGDPTQCFLIPVANRDKKTLLPLIMKYIKAGSTIISDGWASYKDVSKIILLATGEFCYTHQVVNHSKNFKDPLTGAHTNSVEGMWSHWKAPHKQGRGTHRALLSTYMDQFIWFRRFGGPDAFYHLWSQIASMYVTERVGENIGVRMDGILEESDNSDTDDDTFDEQLQRTVRQIDGVEIHYTGDWLEEVQENVIDDVIYESGEEREGCEESNSRNNKPFGNRE